ncbi:hard surface induced protein [Sporothrix brasiliensis 5110]|uniref:Hard surface induced protein n=1 Tax=Sporothrix brasiliensis 5110 TaxID=1398154 RepID=A0A0C2JC57_9PEZI|nr:hard surface induced protein [Sporothrix brasiliensis 5110]KIH94502.1 hard surface induced protein [Sporothrix brasiliensis 5110]
MYAGRIAWPWAWDRDLRPGYDIHLWTIPIEFSHAMLLFVVLLALAPLRTHLRQVLTGVLAGYCLACGRWAAFEFLAGFFLAEVHVLRAATAVPGDHRSTTLSHLAVGAFHSTVLAACLFVAGWPNEDADKTPGIRTLLSNTPAWFLSNGRDEALTEREDWGEALLEQKFWFGLAAVLLVWSCGEFAAARRQFERPLPQYCGRISYAVYLVHGPALDYWKDMTDRSVKPIGMETAVQRMTAWLVGLLFLGSLVVWLADLFWRLVDAPIVALGRTVEQVCLQTDRGNEAWLCPEAKKVEDAHGLTVIVG